MVGSRIFVENLINGHVACPCRRILLVGALHPNVLILSSFQIKIIGTYLSIVISDFTGKQAHCTGNVILMQTLYTITEMPWSYVKDIGFK